MELEWLPKVAYMIPELKLTNCLGYQTRLPDFNIFHRFWLCVVVFLVRFLD